MFLAPDHVFGLGHVGWAYRDDDGSTWDFGSTLSAASSWHKAGAFPAVLAGFHDAADSSGPYRAYRCRDTAGHNAARAAAKAAEVGAQAYHILNNNCLTRSLAIFEAYDDTGGLASLGAGRFTAPRWYFDNDLNGFEAQVAI
jgi:hypothetical protein